MRSRSSTVNWAAKPTNANFEDQNKWLRSNQHSKLDFKFGKAIYVVYVYMYVCNCLHYYVHTCLCQKNKTSSAVLFSSQFGLSFTSSLGTNLLLSTYRIFKRIFYSNIPISIALFVIIAFWMHLYVYMYKYIFIYIYLYMPACT